MTETFKAQSAILDQALAEAEKAATTLLGRVRGLRKRAASGEMGPVPALFDSFPKLVQSFEESAQAARDAAAYDAAAALSDGSYLAELQAEAEAQGVRLIERDGRLTAFPLLLKLEPRMPGVRIGRKLEKRIRPELIIRLLKKAQQAERFNAERFLARLFSAYCYLAPLAQPGWKPGQDGAGAGGRAE